jgi:hypothetical protein
VSDNFDPPGIDRAEERVNGLRVEARREKQRGRECKGEQERSQEEDGKSESE